MNFYYQLKAKKYYKDYKITDLTFLGREKLDVTFAIPNNNGMTRGLPKLLDSIYSQIGVNVNIIIVDSGSSDDSVQYCKSRGCKVIEIEPSKFTHSYSRNKALEHVTTNYVIYTVNDAYFADRNYATKAIHLIKKYNLAAVSGMQYTPHEDIYSQFLERSLSRRFPEIGYIRITKNNLSIATKLLPSYIAGSLYGIDNVNATYDTRILKSIKFINETVEDMSVAKSFIDAGYKIGITKNLSVTHGHVYNNLNDYFSKVYSDLRVIRKLFKVRSLPISKSKLFSTIAIFYLGFIDWHKNNNNTYNPIKLFIYINIFAFKKKYQLSRHDINLTKEIRTITSSHIIENNLKTNPMAILFVAFAVCRHLRFINKEKDLKSIVCKNKYILLNHIILNLLVRLLAGNINSKLDY